jgi:hypothetical protein
MAMRRIACFLLFSFVTAYPVFPRQAAPDGLNGIVVSENGTPIEGVEIFAWLKATTNAEGRFNLTNVPSKDSLVYFQKEGFRPKTLVVKTQTSSLKVVLEDDRKTAWFVPACSAADAKNSHGNSWLRFSWPKNAKVRRIQDVDYVEYIVRLAKDLGSLELWFGPVVGPGRTVEDFILRSATFEERSIRSKSGRMIGYDQRGKTPDGMVWRSADFFGFSASAIYESISEEKATAYDRIIDSVCQPPEQSREGGANGGLSGAGDRT